MNLLSLRSIVSYTKQSLQNRHFSSFPAETKCSLTASVDPSLDSFIHSSIHSSLEGPFETGSCSSHRSSHNGQNSFEVFPAAATADKGTTNNNVTV